MVVKCPQPVGPGSRVACQMRRSGHFSAAQAKAAQYSFGRQIPYGDTFLTAKRFGLFRRVLAHLRSSCPAARPVVVRTSYMSHTIAGECRVRPSRFVICLNDTMGQDEAIETLLHEWAHALAWNYTVDRLMVTPGMTDEAFQQACHDEAWGCAYSKVWRKYIQMPSACR